jgi:hypothetical protein
MMLPSRFGRVVLLAVFVLLATVAAKRRSVRSPQPPPQLLLERSFAVTDKAILEGFTFARVLEGLIARSGAEGVTPESLFRQWFDTQNPGPGLDASAPHCDDSLNGFTRRCPTPEGVLATAPFRAEDFVPLSITNRFDLADPAGSNCGQYRIIFANTAHGESQTLHVIFEGALQNPNPSAGLAACRPVAEFWANLSGVDSMAERRARIERFFFDGIDGFRPVIHPDHYHRAPAGIRTLQGADALLNVRFYQFRLVNECGEGGCRLFMKPDVLENLPWGPLFDAHDQSDRAVRFREAFLQNIPALAINDVNLYHMRIPEEFLIAEADTTDDRAFVFAVSYLKGLSTAEGLEFNDRMWATLRGMESKLVPFDLVARAETQNCVGCHFIAGSAGGGVQFPGPLVGHQHVNERTLEDGEGGPDSRYSISPAMRTFIPHRMQILRDFLATGKAPVHSN